MNSTTDIPETAHTFDPSNFTVVPARTFEDLRVGDPVRWRLDPERVLGSGLPRSIHLGSIHSDRKGATG